MCFSVCVFLWSGCFPLPIFGGQVRFGTRAGRRHVSAAIRCRRTASRQGRWADTPPAPQNTQVWSLRLPTPSPHSQTCEELLYLCFLRMSARARPPHVFVRGHTSRSGLFSQARRGVGRPPNRCVKSFAPPGPPFARLQPHAMLRRSFGHGGTHARSLADVARTHACMHHSMPPLTHAPMPYPVCVRAYVCACVHHPEYAHATRVPMRRRARR